MRAFLYSAMRAYLLLIMVLLLFDAYYGRYYACYHALIL